MVNQATNTVYVASYNDGTVSAINGATCNAAVTSSCARTPPAVPTGAGASFAGIDAAVHTLFAINQGDDTLSAISTRTCRGGAASACPELAPSQQAAPNSGPRYNAFPSSFALMPRLGSLYLVNVGGGNILSVINPSRCDAVHTGSCRRVAPSVPDSEFLTSIDPATNTIYADNQNLPQINVINTATCNGTHTSGCATHHPTVTVGRSPISVAVDTSTGTIYVSDFSSAAISAINGSMCRAAVTSGCRRPARLQAVGSQPLGVSVNQGTSTVYVTQPFFQSGSMSIVRPPENHLTISRGVSKGICTRTAPPGARPQPASISRWKSGSGSKIREERQA